MRTSTNSPAFQLAPARRNFDNPVDLRRIGGGATRRNCGPDLIDQHALHGADLALQTLRRNLLLQLHQVERVAPRELRPAS